MTYKLIDPDALSSPRTSGRDITIISIHLFGMVTTMLLGLVALSDLNSTQLKIICAIGVATFSIGYVVMAKHVSTKMDEFVKSVMTLATLQGMVWIMLYTIFMSLWLVVSKNPSALTMGSIMVFSMPWIGGMFGYGMARIHFIKLNK